MATSARTYGDAIDALNSLQTPFEVVEARRKAGVRPDEAAIREMRAYLARIGHTPADLSRLNVVHVAGTKGKGTTCAFTDSILNHHRLASPSALPRKTGLLISPHLISVRERIRINARPIAEDLFVKYFWEVWDRLADTPAALPELAVPGTRPVYARYMTLLALHAFMREGVECAVLETGIGGEYDATNIVESPVATAVTTLGIDHVFALGDTVEKIAWHKGGIAKPGCPAFSTEQPYEGAARVLKERAEEKGVSLRVIGIDSRLEGVNIRPAAAFQKRNASLAIALAETALAKIDPSFRRQDDALPQDFIDGLEKVQWRGRCEVKHVDGIVWHLDGAHTTDSLKMASRWFVEESAPRKGTRVLIFNQQGRTEAIDFLDGLHEGSIRAGSTTAYDHVVFCTNVTFSTGYKKDFVNHQYDAKAIAALTVQRSFAEKWATLDPAAHVEVKPTIQEALEYVQSLTSSCEEGGSVQAFITGSLHLVGGALEILEGSEAL
ncbi:folylpolyglutamate synthase [Plectosphaerella plurivora]|uniref:Folylpolyglutamate synthase n=1 Tax=Plectosphaerella plurivora TaxID=936078 RepID=A0A9P9A988_9PEZI|nr:folylpolyglutamate synthase [Plectosphaerella plurivora]